MAAAGGRSVQRHLRPLGRCLRLESTRRDSGSHGPWSALAAVVPYGSWELGAGSSAKGGRGPGASIAPTVFPRKTARVPDGVAALDAGSEMLAREAEADEVECDIRLLSPAEWSGTVEAMQPCPYLLLDVPPFPQPPAVAQPATRRHWTSRRHEHARRRRRRRRRVLAHCWFGRHDGGAARRRRRRGMICSSSWWGGGAAGASTKARLPGRRGSAQPSAVCRLQSATTKQDCRPQTADCTRSHACVCIVGHRAARAWGQHPPRNSVPKHPHRRCEPLAATGVPRRRPHVHRSS